MKSYSVIKMNGLHTNQMDESQNIYAEWNEPDSPRQLYDLIYVTFWKFQVDLWGTETDQWLKKDMNVEI